MLLSFLSTFLSTGALGSSWLDSIDPPGKENSLYALVDDGKTPWHMNIKASHGFGVSTTTSKLLVDKSYSKMGNRLKVHLNQQMEELKNPMLRGPERYVMIQEGQ